MALGYLFLWFVIMGVLAIVGTALLFLIKNNKVVDVLLVLMTTYSMSIAFLNAMAQPSNFLGSQILAWLIGFIAVIGSGIRFFTKKQLTVSKILVAGSVGAGIYFLYS